MAGLELQEKHEKILYPVVRVMAESPKGDAAGGSGTIIYSKKKPNSEEYENFVLTCEHVVTVAISFKNDWDSVLLRKVDKEFKKQVQVQVFEYAYMSNVDSSNSYRAEIVAYDEEHDLALLKVDTPKKLPYVASIVPEDKIRDIKVFTPTWTCGCSLLHDPFPNPGNITYLTEELEGKLYWMGNGHSIFGNSGGAVFLAETGEQVGVTARVTTIQLGFGYDVQTWMGFLVPPQRIYQFLKEQEMQFIFDENDTFKAGMERRKKKSEEASLAAKLLASGVPKP